MMMMMMMMNDLHILPGMIYCPVSVQLPCLFSPFPVSECMSVCQACGRQEETWL